jgi:hypothetical protein
MAEVTPILDPESFDEIQKPYEYGPTAYGHVISRFISYLLDEDSIFCRIPDHVSYEGQFALGRKLAASGRNAAKR